MRTSEEIYHRVRWDPRFDPARFVLGVNVRGAAPKRVPLPAFVPGGDIPWHRVLFVEADGELIWDRESGVDRIDDSPAGRVVAARLLRAPFFTARTPHAWNRDWRPAPAVAGLAADGAGAGGPGVRVLTWNTLWDRYDSDRIHTARRRPLLLAALEAADADVIALQEVEPALLGMLLTTSWVRAAYTVDIDPARRDVNDTGLVLLSRLPVRESGRHAFGPYKAAAAITVETVAGPLVVVCTHLTSDHTAGGDAHRDRELAELAEGLGGVDADVVVLGDLNDSGPGPAATLRVRDAWLETHGPDDDTPTFDPRANPLAAVSSLSGRPGRLDRVLLRGPALRAGAVALVGADPDPDGLFASDHYGVVADLTVTGGSMMDMSTVDTLDVAPTARTALAWIPPAELWPPIERIRRTHDPQVDRWPPHVNLLFGFVPEAHFDRAAELVAEATAAIEPFTARLDGLRSFAHRDSATVWLDPGGAGSWLALREALLARFPHCAGRAEGYTPHLTLGRSPQPAAMIAECAPVLSGRTTTVGELVLLSRRGDEPMRARATVKLGTGTVLWASTVEVESAPGAERAGPVLHQLSAALADGVVEVTGSRRMGCAAPDADLDLVAALPGTVDLARIEARVRAAVPGATRIRPVVGARVPGLRMRVGTLTVDLAVVGVGAMRPDDAVTRREELGEAAATTLSAVSDATAVRDAVGPRQDAFARLARAVKRWARARGLDSAPHGGLPGLAWAVLAARTVREADDATDADGLLRRFFATWAGWDWRRPVTLLGDGDGDVAGDVAGAGPDGSAVSILTPTAPVRSCTAQVGPGWRDLLTEELFEAWEQVEAGPLAATAPPLHRRHAAWAVLTVTAPAPDALDALLGRVRGRTRSLLTALEEAGVRDHHAWPRPIPGAADGGGANTVRYVVGLGRTPPDAGQLRAVAGPWTGGLTGVDVTWAEGGAVPTLH